MAAQILPAMFDGSLRDDWRALVTLQQLLILCDAEGRIEMTAQAIAARTGIPLDLIIEGIAALEQPDPQSRTPDFEGRRIARLDPRRVWGWRIINFRKYQTEISKSEGITAPGEFALVPPESRAGKKLSRLGTRLPEDFRPDLEYARQLIPDIDAVSESERFRDYWNAQSGQRGVKADWPATWRNWIRNCRDRDKYARKSASTSAHAAPVFR
jgi:hypothetical protein